MFHNLGNTRSSLKADHLLQTPDTFIRTPLPGASGVEFVIHTAPRIGASFAMMTAEFAAGGALSPTSTGIQRFVYVLDGALDLKTSETTAPSILKPGQYAYLPANSDCKIWATEAAKAVLIEKPYQPVQPGPNADTGPEIETIIGDESSVKSEPLGGDPSLQVKHLMPDGPVWDFAVNTMTYDPGASLAMVEIHVMEHGLLMLEGGGIYRLGDHWYPVSEGDFIWMAPYCPQWFGALGKKPAKYLIYKDWYRHPLGEK